MFFSMLLDFPCFFLIIQLLLIADRYEKTVMVHNPNLLNKWEKTWEIK